MSGMMTPQPPAEPQVRSSTLISTLAVAGAIAGFLIVTVFQWADPRIQAHQARAMGEAIDGVLASPARVQTLFVYNDELTAQPPAGVDTLSLERIWVGFDDAGNTLGYALVGAEPGFADVIKVMFGYDPVTKSVLGMQILESKETPGLGDKIFKDSAYVHSFRGAVAPLAATKPGTGTGDEREVDTITGATISSRTVIGIINNRIAQVQPLLERLGRQ